MKKFTLAKNSSFLQGCGIYVWDEDNNLYFKVVLKERQSGRLFIEHDNKKYYEDDINQ